MQNQTASHIFSNPTAAACYVDYWKDRYRDCGARDAVTRDRNQVTITTPHEGLLQEFRTTAKVFSFAVACGEEILADRAK